MTTKFPSTFSEAKVFQEKIAKKAILADSFSKTDIIGSFDVAYKKDIAYAAGVIFDTITESVIEERAIKEKVGFPYVPGYLFLREVPHFLSLVDRLSNVPDVMIIDGHGIAHPRSTGSATIFGIMSDIPSIGVAKKPMKYFEFRRTEQSNLDEVYLNEKLVGYKHGFMKKWNPIFISPGHKISINTSYKIVKGLLTSKYKLPIPQQSAHLLAAKSKEELY